MHDPFLRKHIKAGEVAGWGCGVMNWLGDWD